MTDKTTQVELSETDIKKLKHLESIIRSERFLRWMVAFLAITTIFCCAVVTVQYRQNRIHRQQLLEINQDNNHIVRQIESCTLPTGECYMDNDANRKGYFSYLDAVCKRQNEMAILNGNGRLTTPCPISPINTNNKEGE